MVSGNFTLFLWFTFRAQVIAFAEHKYIQLWDFHQIPRIDLSRGFYKNDLSAQLQIQPIGFKPNLSHFSV